MTPEQEKQTEEIASARMRVVAGYTPGAHGQCPTWMVAVPEEIRELVIIHIPYLLALVHEQAAKLDDHDAYDHWCEEKGYDGHWNEYEDWKKFG